MTIRNSIGKWESSSSRPAESAQDRFARRDGCNSRIARVWLFSEDVLSFKSRFDLPIYKNWLTNTGILP